MGQQLQLQLQLWQPLPKGHWEEGAPLTHVIETEGEGTHGGTVYTSLLHQISKFKLKGRGSMAARQSLYITNAPDLEIFQGLEKPQS